MTKRTNLFGVRAKMSNKPEEKLYVIRKIEVEQYHDFCNSYMQKTKLVLGDFLCNNFAHSEKAFSHVCDINAQCSALSEILHGFFDLDMMEYEKSYQMKEKVAAAIIKIYLTTLNSIQVLKKHNIFLESN